MIELATLPPIVQHDIQENGAVELRLVEGQIVATPKQERVLFEIEQMQKAIGETDENGRSKNAIAVPMGLTKDRQAFKAWIKANAG